MTRSSFRKAALASATAALTATGLGLVAAPADAATAPAEVTLQQPATVAMPSSGTVQGNFSWTSNRNLPFAQATISVDARGLAKVAKVAFSPECSASGLVARCPEYLDLQVGTTYGAPNLFTLSPLPGAHVGATGNYRISGTVTGAVFRGATGQVTVGGPEYYLNALAKHQNVPVGSVVSQPVTFSNRGNRPADGSDVALMLSPGLRFAQHYGNCSYLTYPHNGVTYDSAALCHFSDVMRVGEEVTLAQPVKTQVTRQALWTYLDVMAFPAGDASAQTLGFHPGTWHRGTGPTLGLKRLIAGRAVAAPAGTAQLQSENGGYGVEFVDAKNTADYGVTGSSAKAAAGGSVTMGIAMTNHGPAALYDRSGGEATPFVKVTAPAGTTIVPNDDCSTVSSTVAYCSAGMSAILAYPGDTFKIAVTLHVNKVVAGARGEVQLAWGGGPNPSTTLPFDPNPRNNTAWLVLN